MDNNKKKSDMNNELPNIKNSRPNADKEPAQLPEQADSAGRAGQSHKSPLPPPQPLPLPNPAFPPEGHPVPPCPPPHPLPPHDPEHMQNEKFRARFELDSAYRDLRRGELVLQQIETYLPNAAEASFSRKLLETASEIYQTAYKNYQKESFYKAAEYSAAVKDLMRGIDKFYNTAGPYPIYPEPKKNNTLTGGEE